MRCDAADWALAGLALVENATEGNQINRNAVLSTTDAGELVVGLVTLASTLRASLAAAWGIPVEQLDELLRTQFLFTAAIGGAV